VNEVALLAAADEAFGVAFELVPDVADLGGFFVADGIVEGGLADGGQEIGELLDDFLGGGHDLKTFAAVARWVFDKNAPGFHAEPLEDLVVLSEAVELQDAVQGIGGATAFFIIGLGPFIDERERDAHLGSDFLGVAFFESAADDFVGFHNNLSSSQSSRHLASLSLAQRDLKKS
jgi:hypothetical protein